MSAMIVFSNADKEIKIPVQELFKWQALYSVFKVQLKNMAIGYGFFMKICS